MRLIVIGILILACAAPAAALEDWQRFEDPGVERRAEIMRRIVLDHFALGTTAPLEWFEETRSRNGCRWDFIQAYFSGGAGWDGTKSSWDTVFLHNWNKWENPDKRKGAWAEKRINPWSEAGFIPWITFYNLAQSHPADYQPGPAKATPVNARNTTTMRAYWEQVKLLMQLSAKVSPRPVVIHVEPDEWGHLLLGAGARPLDPLAVDVKVGATGMPELAGFPDDLRGYSEAFRKLRAEYAPENVLLACNPSAWDQNGSMRAEEWVRIFKTCNTTAWDMAVLETGDRDIGCTPGKGLDPPYDTGTRGSHFGSLEEQLRYVGTLHQGTGLPVYFWQVAVGNTFFRSVDQTKGHFADCIAEGLLEGYPENPMIARYVDVGCAGFVFSPGQGHQTRVFDAMKDGITNPDPIPGNKGLTAEYADDDGGYLRTRAAAYYRQPFPILGEPTAQGGTAKGGSGAAGAQRTDIANEAAPIPDPDPEALARRLDELKQATIAASTSRRPPRFAFGRFGRVEVRDFDGERATLRLLDLESETGIAFWDLLKPADHLALAEALIERGAGETYARAAFFAFVVKDRRRAQGHLLQAGEHGRPVKRAFAPAEPTAATETEERPE